MQIVCSSVVWTAAVIRSPSCAYARAPEPATVRAGVSVRCDAEPDAPAAPYTVRPAHAAATHAARTLIPTPDGLSMSRSAGCYGLSALGLRLSALGWPGSRKHMAFVRRHTRNVKNVDT